MQVQVIRKSAAEYVVECASQAAVATLPAPRKFYSRGEAEQVARAEAEAYGVRAYYRDPANNICHAI